ncbi:MAG: YkgJ family cysteine cluster protein [Planctomycetota bacterium]
MSRPGQDWFDRAPFGPSVEGGRRRTEAGLRFSCTMCGNCCTGAPGVVDLDEDEADALADHLGMDRSRFDAGYTKFVDGRRSLTERLTAFGYDCVFLDRTTIPGRAVCGVYDHRPSQCRTWPFWKSNLASERSWATAASGCPGMNRGTFVPADRVRIIRDSSPA